AVACDPHIEIGELDCRPARTARRRCGGFARSVVFHQCRGDAARVEGSDSLSATTSVNAGSAGLVADVEALGERLRLVRERSGEVIFGQAEVIEQALITLLSGGHA